MKVTLKPNGKLDDRQLNGLLAEYNALRTEIIKHIDIRNSILLGTLILAGVLMGLGLIDPMFALIYIIISVFLAAARFHSEAMISKTGRYIRQYLEYTLPGLYWETKLYEEFIPTRKINKFMPDFLFSTRGVFLITQAVALVIALSNIDAFTFLEWSLSGIALICIICTFLFFQTSNKGE
jgi:hypothetical protein